jgi:hypothetical protein
MHRDDSLQETPENAVIRAGPHPELREGASSIYAILNTLSFPDIGIASRAFESGALSPPDASNANGIPQHTEASSHRLRTVAFGSVTAL